jgi:predicted AlkP superfamily pyrophosphatase or phosphodiesterase
MTTTCSLLRRRLSLALLLIFWFAFSACSTPPVKPVGELSTELTYEVPVMNSPEMISHPTVILVSIDGYRADYNSLFSPPNLQELERAGVSAKGLRPAYPSKTFPNHYTLVTGMTPAHHGIVSNEFYDSATKKSFAISDKNAVRDGSWYLAEPIWLMAEHAGMRTASYFWVGSEANIDGAYPNYYFNYSDQVSNSDRVDRALQWLKLAPELRPHLIMVYFSVVDTSAHLYGTKSPQMRDAVMQVDQQIGRLREGVKASPNTNLVVVSDHGMADLDPMKVALIDESSEVAELLPKFKVTGRGPQMQFYLNDGEAPANIARMKSALDRYAKANHKNFRVITAPKDFMALKYGPTSRTGDLVIDPELPWVVGTKGAPPAFKGGNHGWNPKNSVMHGIFYAEGPAFRPHAILSTVDNINVTPLLLKVLDLPIPKNLDGRLSAMKNVLATRPRTK